MANLVADGATSVDMFAYDIARFPEARHVSDEEWLHQSVHESEVRTYWIGYPGRQKMAGRNVRNRHPCS